MIRLIAVTYQYPRSQRPALRGVDWHVEPEEFVLITGTSGSGKTSLLRCLNGLVPHFHGGRFAGRVVVAGLDTREHGPARLSHVVGYVAQDPETQTLLERVEDEILFGLENAGTPPAAARARLEEALDLLGITGLRSHQITTLSGGERQRVALAAVLAMRPRVLALDEPTSQLDPWAAESVLDVLRRLVDELGLTVVVAEQRLERLAGLCSRVLYVEGEGQIVLDGRPHDIVPRLPAHPSLARVGIALGWSPPPLTVREARAHLRASGLDLATGRRRTVRTPAGRATVELDRVSVRAGSGWAVRDVSLCLEPGVVTFVLGRNGAGKTTLLRQIAGLSAPDRGRVTVLGRETTTVPRGGLGKVVGYVPQHPSSLLFCETVEEELHLARRARPCTDSEVAQILERLGLTQVRQRHPYDLSGGERQRLALAIALIGRPPILVLDEPTRGLDPGKKDDLGALLGELAEAGATVVVATHDVEFAAAWSDRVLLLADGEIVADGAPTDVLAGTLAYSTQVNRAFGGTLLTAEDVLAAVAVGHHQRDRSQSTRW